LRRSSSRALAALLVARAAMEAIAFACLLALVHSAGGGLEPVAVLPTVLALAGVTLIVLAALRETGSEARGAAIVVTTLGAGALLAVVLPAHPLDVVGWGARLILFVVLAEVYLWRLVSLARGAVRWSDARNGVPFAALALGLAATVPLAVDRGPLVLLALVLVAASAVALSVARATEELSLSTGPTGQARLSSANLVVFALGVGALVAAAVTPTVEQLLRDLGTVLAPVYDQLILYLLLPLGYLAAIVYAILERILQGLDLSRFGGDRSLRSPEEDAALLREIERTRPFVVGGFEVLIAIVVVLVALVLLERAVRERRIALPEGAEVERSTAAGLTLGAMLRSLFPRRPSARRAPHDDGTPAAALRLLYWRLLAVAERAGHGWRLAAATPSEHQEGLAAADPRWSEAMPIVAAFEELRYGEVAPDADTLNRARAALRAVEAATRT
jgi:hypothetical protein